MNIESLTLVGEYGEISELDMHGREKIYKDLEGNFFLKLPNKSLINYPFAVRIQDFVSTWDNAYYVDGIDGRYHYVVYPYDGIVLDIWESSIDDLLELIRQFVTPSDEINSALESSVELHQYYENTAKADFGRERDN